jgi:AraC-like DNA-binding protein
MDGTWFHRLEAERRAGNLTRAEADALRAFGRLLTVGDDAPSEARIASEAGCSRRTVQRAKVRARGLGLMDWERRFLGAGLRRELPCRYRAGMPAGPVVRRERQKGRAGTERLLRRSVQAQLAACGPVTADLLRLWEERRQRLAEAARNRVGKGLSFAAVR